jgi:ketosteroid isomerase-like protein
MLQKPSQHSEQHSEQQSEQQSEDIPVVATNPARLSIVGTLALVALFLGCQPPEARGAEPKAGIEAEEQAIGELVGRQLVAAVNARDYEAVRTRLTDDWTYVTSAGRWRNFEDWKGLVQRYSELRIEFTDVRAEVSEDGRLAWSTFCGRIRGKVDGNVDERDVLYTAVISKVDDEWKLRHLQGTESSQSC